MKAQWIFAAAFVAGSSVSALAANPDAANPDGKALFNAHCAMCHHTDGSGGLKVGTAVSADLRSPGLEDTYGHSDALLLRAILEGKDEEGGNLDMVMPHWKGQLTKTQAQDIVAYVKTLCCHRGKEKEESQ